VCDVTLLAPAGKYLDEVQEIGELSPHPAQRVGALLRAASLAASQAAAAAGEPSTWAAELSASCI
jgi:hypothetical protein